MYKTLFEKPDGMSQLCGYRISYGAFLDAYCGEYKADGLYFCRGHHRATVERYGGGYGMAPGNVRGRLEWQEEPRRREVPRNSGESAIYSVEYLTRREGDAYGTEPLDWRYFADR